MADGKLLHRIVVWPTYEDALQAEQEAESADCKRSNKLTVWQTYEQAAENTHIDDDEGEGGGGGDLPEAPEGFSYLVDADGAYLVDADGAYILSKD